MNFCPERLIQLRESLNINKAEAARRLNISAMAYGRYEKGDREPSYQTVSFIAQTFQCNIDFLYGISDDISIDCIQISSCDSPDLYALVECIQDDPALQKRLLVYAQQLRKKEDRPSPAQR